MGETDSSFLGLIPLSQASAHGVNLSSKEKHILAKTVQRMTTPRNARDNNLFYPEIDLPELKGFAKERTNLALSSLLVDQLISVVFRFDYDPNQKKLLVRYFFLARPEDKFLSAEQVYEELLLLSTASIGKYVAEMAPLDNSLLVKELEQDLQTKYDDNQPKAKKNLPEYKILLNLPSLLRQQPFAFNPIASLVSRFIRELCHELENNKTAALLPGYDYLPLNPAHLPGYMALLHNFLLQKLIPYYKDHQSIKREMEILWLEEKLFEFDNPDKKTTAIDSARAETLRKYLQAEVPPGADARPFGGGLAIGFVLAIADQTQQIFDKAYKEQISNEVQQLKAQLKNTEQGWNNLILFLHEQENNQTRKEVISQLNREPELVSTDWNFPEGQANVYIWENETIFKILAAAMGDLPDRKTWQIQAFLAILEKSEKLADLLLADETFRSNYENLLLKAHAGFIPWYLSFFLWLKLGFIRRRAIELGRENLGSQQKYLADKNRERNFASQRERDFARQKQTEKIGRLKEKHRLGSLLDDSYFVKKTIPVRKLLADSLPDLKADGLDKLLASHSFQIIPGGDNDPANDIIFYAIDQNWHSLRSQVTKVLAEIEKNQSASDNLLRALTLKKFLEKKPASVGKKESKEEEDPYQKLEQIIEKEKKRSDPLEKYF